MPVSRLGDHFPGTCRPPGSASQASRLSADYWRRGTVCSLADIEEALQWLSRPCVPLEGLLQEAEHAELTRLSVAESSGGHRHIATLQLQQIPLPEQLSFTAKLRLTFFKSLDLKGTILHLKHGGSCVVPRSYLLVLSLIVPNASVGLSLQCVQKSNSNGLRCT